MATAVRSNKASATHYDHLIAGLVAGFASTVVFYPLELIKTRMQVDESRNGAYRTILGSFHRVVKTEGVAGLYKGLTPAVLASCGAERRVMVWDLSRVGAEQNAEDAEDGPPELLFSHGGHTARVSDFAWNARQEWTLASVAEDHELQIWRPASALFQDEEGEL